MKPDSKEKPEILSASLDEPLFVVMGLTRKFEIVLSGVIHMVPLTGAEGLVGALPVFRTLEEANNFSAGKFDVLKIKK